MTFGSGDRNERDKAGRAELSPPSRANRAMPIILLRCRNLVDGGIDNFTALQETSSLTFGGWRRRVHAAWIHFIVLWGLSA